MHEINKGNKKMRAVKNFSNYFIGGIIIAGMSFVLVLMAQGYDIDRETGEVIQNGIILVESQPDGAEVMINGVSERDRTPSRLPVPQGNYEVEINKPGFKPWSTQVELFGSSVNWLYYPLLVPESIATTEVANINNASFLAQSPDQGQLLYSIGGSLNSFSLLDLGASSLDNRKTVTIPSRILSSTDDTTTGSLEFIEWSQGADTVLFKYLPDQNTEQYILVDLVRPNDSVNISRTLKAEYDEVYLTSERSRLYARAGDRAYELDLSILEESVAVSEGLVDFDVEGSQGWAMIRSEAAETSAIYQLSALDRPIIKTDIQAIEFEVSDREGDRFAVVRTPDEVDIFTEVSLSESERNVPSKVIVLSSSDAQVQISPLQHRFVAVVYADSSVVYDLETVTEFDHQQGSNDYLVWLDGHRVQYIVDGSLFISDFDAENPYRIASVDASFNHYIDADKTAIYSVFTGSDNRQTLRASSLEFEEN